jgi:chromate reductase, NAD(P)H dehydrogenase (quinone)
VDILAICGSLRAGSYNRGLLRAVAEAVPEGVSVEIAEIRGIPVFDEDLEAQGWPEAVAALRARAHAATGWSSGRRSTITASPAR